MASKTEDIEQPNLPSNVFPQRNPDEGGASLKGGFIGWYQRNFMAPQESVKCEKLVDSTLKHPAMKLLIRAMESSGCRFNPRRHIACEPCATMTALGAYDYKHNQVVVCSNVCRKSEDMYHLLGYNMLQMFDACRAHVNFGNLDHLACAEIRSNNLFVCGTYKSGRERGGAPLLGYEGKQHECVRKQATMSVQQMTGVDELTARAAVDRVFGRCYFDLEPFGQRFENERTAEILYERRRNYGYY